MKDIETPQGPGKSDDVAAADPDFGDLLELFELDKSTRTTRSESSSEPRPTLKAGPTRETTPNYLEFGPTGKDQFPIIIDPATAGGASDSRSEAPLETKTPSDSSEGSITSNDALPSSAKESREEGAKQEESPEQRSNRFAERFEFVTGQPSTMDIGPEKELHKWADSWRDFVEVVEVPEGSLRNLLQELGSQTLIGELDGKKLSELMNGIKKSEDLQMDLEDFNASLDGAEVTLNFKDDGTLASLEFATLPRKGEADASLKVDATGKISAEGKDTDDNPLSQEDSVKRIAKRVSPQACP